MTRNMDRALGDGGMPLLGDLGMSFDRYGDGWAEAAWIPTDRACNVGGVVQGGVYAVVLDASMNFATQTVLTRGDFATTLDIQYRMLRAARAGDALRIRGTVARETRQVAYLESVATNADGDAVAEATATYLLRRAAATD